MAFPYTFPFDFDTIGAPTTVGSITPTGALVKVPITLASYAGSLTPTGALSWAWALTMAGSMTPTATLVKGQFLTPSGSISMAGTLARSISNLQMAGALTPTGALTKVMSQFQSYSGSITPTGAVARVTKTTLEGAIWVGAGTRPQWWLFPSDGILSRKSQYTIPGSTTPSGTLATVRTQVKSVSGVLTPSGAVVVIPSVSFAGSIAMSGILKVRGRAVHIESSIGPRHLIKSIITER